MSVQNVRAAFPVCASSNENTVPTPSLPAPTFKFAIIIKSSCVTRREVTSFTTSLAAFIFSLASAVKKNSSNPHLSSLYTPGVVESTWKLSSRFTSEISKQNVHKLYLKCTCIQTFYNDLPSAEMALSWIRKRNNRPERHNGVECMTPWAAFPFLLGMQFAVWHQLRMSVTTASPHAKPFKWKNRRFPCGMAFCQHSRESCSVIS